MLKMTQKETLLMNSTDSWKSLFGFIFFFCKKYKNTHTELKEKESIFYCFIFCDCYLALFLVFRCWLPQCFLLLQHIFFICSCCHSYISHPYSFTNTRGVLTKEFSQDFFLFSRRWLDFRLIGQAMYHHHSNNVLRVA